MSPSKKDSTENIDETFDIDAFFEQGVKWIQNNILERVNWTQRLNTNITLDVLKNDNIESFEPEMIETTSNIINFSRVHVDFGIPISKLKIKNVKSFRNLSIKPSSLNLFAGKNSSGKSTILETIALLSNWSHTQNTVYDGIPFKFDFGIKNLKEFKSNLSAQGEDIVLEITATNYLDEFESPLGAANISFTIDTNKSSLEDLKYAPIKAITLHFDNKNKFGSDDKGFTAVNTVIDYKKQPGQTEKLEPLFVTGSKIMASHSERLKEVASRSKQDPLYKLIQKAQDDPEILKHLDFGFFKKNIEFEKTYNHKKSEQINKKIKEENILDNYIDLSICTENSGSGIRNTRLYGTSFSSGEKKFTGTKVSDAETIIPIDKFFLIRWLAIDYIQQIAQNEMIENDLDQYLKDLRVHIEHLLTTNKTLKTNLNEELTKTKGASPPLKTMKKIRDKMKKELFMMNLKVSEGGSYEFAGLFDFPDTNPSNKIENINLDNLIQWIKKGNTSLGAVIENKKTRENLFTKQSLDKNSLESLKDVYANIFDNSTELLKSADDAILALTSGADIGDVLESMYSNINNIIEKSGNIKIHIYSKWEDCKYYLLEILSGDTLINQNDLESEKNVLISFGSNLFSSQNGGIFNNINSHMRRSFENLFSTIFIGPLRERSEFIDDVFSYEYPLTLGMKGEKSLSFLTTFKNNEILFPNPNLISDVDEGKLKTFDEYLQSGTYEEHLSNWLKFLQLAEKITISSDGKIEVLQNSDKANKASLDNIGVGVSQVLPVLLSCMTTQKNEENEILLLEQPELHLHPSAQAKLADFFIAVSVTNRKALFVETHSEHILNRLRLRKIQLKNQKEFIKIFFTTRDGNVETDIEEFTINKDGSYDFESYPEGFFDQTQIESREIAKALLDEMNKKN